MWTTKYSRLFSTLLLIASLAFIPLACQPSPGGEPSGDREEWTVLFDGTDTDHWRGYNMDEVPESWVIEGDELVFRPEIARGGLDLISRETYADFELRAEYSISEGGNSGIFHHVLEQDQAIYWSAPEYQILDDEAYPGNRDNQLSASLYDLLPAEPQNANPPGEWNSVRIISEGPRVEYWQNDERVVVFERWTAEWYEMVRNSKFECHPAFGNVPEGHVGFQDHGDEVRFRNVMIRRL